MGSSAWAWGAAPGPGAGAAQRTCPRGTELNEAACIEVAKRNGGDPLPVPTAEAVCRTAERRLPTVMELQTFRLRRGQDVAADEHTSHVWTDLGGPVGRPSSWELVVGGAGVVREQGQGPLAFRCVAPRR